MPNIDAFADEWSLSRDDLRLWVCVHEIAHHAVFGVPHVRAAIDDLLQQLRLGLPQRPGRARGAPRRARPHRPDARWPSLQELIGSPDLVLGAITSPEQDALRPRLEALVAVVVGVVDHVLDVVGGKLIASYPMLTEALRRRRVEAGGVRPLRRAPVRPRARPGHLRPRRRVRRRRAWSGPARRACAASGPTPANLPTPPEVDAPGLWLARLDLDLDPD